MNLSRLTARTARNALLAGAVVLALAACGGGTTQFEPFAPDRYVAFGDESSLLTADGRKYSVNALNTAEAVDCTTEPLWVQAVANQYGFKFAECNPDGVTPKAVLRSALGLSLIHI